MMLYSWEGNHSSGITLLCITDFTGLAAYILGRGDEHPGKSMALPSRLIQAVVNK